MTWTSERARVAALSRSRSADDLALLSAKRNLRAAHLAEYIAKTLDASPPLTNDQRETLALLLTGSTPAGGAAA